MRTQVEIEHERAINAAASATLKAYREATDDAHITAADVIALHRRADAPIAGKEAVMTGTEARTRYEAITSGKLESRHWPGLFYSPADPEPLQDNMLGTKDAKWRAWFERNGGKLK